MTTHPSAEDHDVQQLVEYCKARLDLTYTEPAGGYGYVSLPLSVIDAVFSIGVNYTSTRNTVLRFRDYFGINKLAGELSIADFIELHTDKSAEFMAREVYKNLQRTSPRSGILKAEAALRVAQTLAQFGVNYRADVDKVINQPDFEAAFRQIPGQTSGISLRYFYMLAGSKVNIKPDRMIMRFIQNAIGKTANVDECHRLLVAACRLLMVDYPELNPRSLDHLIWQYQRNQPQ